MQKLKVGLIGLGQVAQITHIPILKSLPDKFEIAALCDVSPQLLECLGRIHNVANLYTDAHELVKQDDLDIVFVLNSHAYHAEHAIAAARHKKHVLIEKPMCLTMSEAQAIIQARDESGVHIAVGYMRRFAPAFTQAAGQVKELGKINYARIRAIIGRNALFIDQACHYYKFDDIPEAAKQDNADRTKRLLLEAIGDASPEMRARYMSLCGLSSHDLSAMREILGMPKRVAAAKQWNGTRGQFLNVIFEYEDYCAMFETGTDNIRRFDAHIQVYGENKSLLVKYDTPYIRHLPTTLAVQETVGEALHESVTRPTFKDPYTIELEHLHQVITEGIAPKTTPEDYIEDLRLFQMIMEALRQ
jgi:predicted dehydrogenase